MCFSKMLGLASRCRRAVNISGIHRVRRAYPGYGKCQAAEAARRFK
jgi:hypothetical protein